MQKLGKLISKDTIYDVDEIEDPNGNLHKVKRKINISVIASNFEKYMGFRLGRHLTFIDSFSFMSQSLDRISSNLSEDMFIYTKNGFTELEAELEEDKYKLIKKKGVYPYDYMDSFSRFNETSLPSRKYFYSILNDTNISEEEYSHAKDVWSAFNIRNLGEYHDLYLKTDVLLLADVFENFRNTCLQYYRLDPCHYYSPPGYHGMHYSE